MKKHLDIIQIWIDGNYDKAITLLKEQPPIVQYYLIKGLKLAKKDVFDAAFRGAGMRTSSQYQNRTEFIKNLLVEVYDYREGAPEDNYYTAYNGMGNLDTYVAEIKKL